MVRRAFTDQGLVLRPIIGSSKLAECCIADHKAIPKDDSSQDKFASLVMRSNMQSANDAPNRAFLCQNSHNTGASLRGNAQDGFFDPGIKN
jgi:hypothetical protein